MGLTLAGASSIPAPDSNHIRMAMATGRRIVEMVWTQQTLSTVLTQHSFDNGIVACSAMAGSTNAIIHLVAMAGRCGFELPLEHFDAISARTPVLADIRPSGRFLMEDFYYAGGLPALLSRIRQLLHLECMTVSGKTLGDHIQNARVVNDEVIRPLDRPVRPDGGTVVLRGNLAPDGAIIKPAAADSKLLRHRGRALVFDSMADLEARVHDPDLPVTADTVLVLRNAGPLGGPGMPEWGMLPIPKKLLDQGIRDMVRISDARMSGTSYGACVVHVAPESYVGGPLALVRNGDWIELDVPNRALTIDLPESELSRRKQEWRRPAPRYARGYGSLYTERVTQANLGCDFDFLQAGEEIPEPAIF
jgi:dihydroxy-acid dehydratase